MADLRQLFSFENIRQKADELFKPQFQSPVPNFQKPQQPSFATRFIKPAVNAYTQPIHEFGTTFGQSVSNVFNANRINQEADELRRQNDITLSRVKQLRDSGQTDQARNLAKRNLDLVTSQNRGIGRQTGLIQSSSIGQPAKLASSGFRTGLTAIGSVSPSLVPTMAFGGAIGAGMAKFQGRDALTGLAEGIGGSAKFAGLNTLTNPILGRVLSKASTLANDMVGQGVIKGLASGAFNVAEDQFYTRLAENRVPGMDENLFSFFVGSLSSAVSRDDTTMFKKDGDKLVYDGKRWRDHVGKYSKEVDADEAIKKIGKMTDWYNSKIKVRDMDGKVTKIPRWQEMDFSVKLDEDNLPKKVGELDDYAPQEAVKTSRPKLERLKGETGDQARARVVGYQVDNGVVSIKNNEGGWEAKAMMPSFEKPKVISGMFKKQDLINQVYDVLNPKYGTVETKKVGGVGESEIPDSLRDLARNTVWGKYDKEKFLREFDEGLKNQNLTTKETVQNTVDELKKNGMTPESFYDKFAKRISRVDELERKMSRATGDPQKYESLRKEWQKVKYEGLSRNPEEMKSAKKALDESLGITPQPVGGDLAKEASKYKTTVNMKNPDDVEYLKRILSDDSIEAIKKGEKFNWRGTSYEDLAKVNIVNEAYTKPKLKLEPYKGTKTFYHGTSPQSADLIVKEGFKAGSDLPEDAFRSGGYGQLQGSISLSSDPKSASVFTGSGSQGALIKTEIKPNSKIVTVKGIDYAEDLNDFIPQLKKDGVDAVWIGGGEKELVVINPKAIKVGDTRKFTVFDKDSQLTDIYNQAKGVGGDLAKEASKYKSAEEYRDHIGGGDNYLEFIDLYRKETGKDISLGGQPSTVSKQEWRDKTFYPAITDIYNQAKGVGGDLATEAKIPKEFQDLAEELKSVGSKVNNDLTVDVYHATTKENASQILKDGVIKRPADAPDAYGVYFGTNPSVAESYGDGTVIKMRIPIKDLNPDDIFPGRRMDFRVETKGGVYKPVSIESNIYNQATKGTQTTPKLVQVGVTPKKAEVSPKSVVQKTPSQISQTTQKEYKAKVKSFDSIISEGRKQIGSSQPKKAKTVKEELNNLYTQWVDRYHPITQASTKVKGRLKTMGAELRPEADPTVLVRRLTGAGGIADARFKTELNPVLKEMEGLNIDKTDMDVYLANKRMAGLEGRDIYGVDVAKSKEIISALEAKYDGISNIAEKLYTYQDRGFQEMIASGFLDQKSADIIKQKNPDYSPLYRVMDEVDNYLGLPTRKTMQGTQPIAKLKGSKRKIESPVEGIIGNTFRQRAAIEKNRVAKAIVGLQDIVDIGFTKASKSGSNTITIWKDGKKEYWRVGQDIADTAKGVNEESMNMVLKILKAPASLLRQGATGRNPEFMIPNVIRDQLDAGISSKYGYIPFIDYVSGLKSMITNDDIYKKWANSGANIDLGEMSGKKSVKASFDEATAKKGLFNWISKGMDTMGKYSEQPTRIGLFKKGFNKTGNELLAMMESRDATVDFARMGSKMKTANSIVPFLNVGVQGFDKLIRAVKDNPGKVMLNSAIYAAAPAIATTIHNLSQYPQEYSEIPQYEKDSNFVIVTGRNENGTVDYLTFPKGNIIPTIANPLQSFLEYAYGEDKQSFKEMALSTISNTLPVVGSGSSLKEIGIKTVGQNLPQAIKPITENLINKSFYKYDPNKEQTKDIVPSYLQNRPEYKQDYPFTPQMYKKIGAAFDASPLKVKNLLEGYLAGYSKIPAQIVEMMYKSGRGMEISPNEKTLMRRFVKQTYPSSGQKATFKPESPGLMERLTGKASAADMTPEQEKFAIEDKKYEMRSNGDQWSMVGNKYLVTKDNGDIGTIDVEKVASLPSTNGYEKLIKQKESYKLVDDILDNLPEEQQAEALGKLGIDSESAVYYNVARQSNDLKSAYILDKVTDIAKSTKDRTEMLTMLQENRLTVNGKQILSNGVIDDLYNMNLISSAEKKALKALDFTKDGDQYKLKTTGRGKSASIKKFTAVKPGKVKFVPLKISKPKKSTITSKDSFAKIKLK